MADTEWRTIVGVVGDVAQYSLTGFPDWIDGVQYVPLAQWLPLTSSGFESTMLVESTRPREAMFLADAVRRSFPDVVVSRVQSLEGIRSESVADQRSTAWLLALFAGLVWCSEWLAFMGSFRIERHSGRARSEYGSR